MARSRAVSADSWCGRRHRGGVILFNYSGHGFLDLSAYDAYNHGQLVDE